MTELDGELPELVLELIEEFGAEIVYRYVEGGSYNPATSSNAKSESAPKSIKALVADYNSQGSGAAFTSGLIKAGDKQFYVAASAFSVAPSAGDEITFNGSTFALVNVKTTYSGQLAALHELQARS